MKHLSNYLIFLILILPAKAEELIWESFDDFNDNSFDSSLWTDNPLEIPGNAPIEKNGRIELIGNSASATDKQTFLGVKDLTGIKGVEAEISLPNNAPSNSGIMIGLAVDDEPTGYIDLWYHGNNYAEFEIFLANSSANESKQAKVSAQLGLTYKVAVVFDSAKTSLLLNGQEVASVSAFQSQNKKVLFRGVNDSGFSFSAFVDNVKVLRPKTVMDLPSKWMWHGAFPWIYSDADKAWWYKVAGANGKFYAWKQSDKNWYFFNTSDKKWDILTEPINSGNISNDSSQISSLQSQLNSADEHISSLNFQLSEKTLALKSAEEKIIILENQLSNLKENETNSTGQKPTHLIELNSTVSIEMLWVEPGTFTMGSPTTEAGRSSIETEHNVTLTSGFYLGKYEVTQAQYEAVMAGNTDGLSATPSYFSNSPNRPVEIVSWNDIQVFLTRLNQSDSTNIPVGWAYVLPTEAQWEYACRAGTTTAYSWGSSISSSNANYNSIIGETQDVGQYSPNAWGFFDMHGNVWEWVADRYGNSYYGSNAVIDPIGPASGSSRVTRGGSWGNVGAYLRSAKRDGSTPGNRNNDIGFRVGFQKVQ